jgi:type IV secretion system protein VirB3
MIDDEGIKSDPLAVALTRPTTKWGVTYPALVLNMVVSVEALVMTHNLLWALICVPIHGISYLICLNDARTFELLLLWSRTKFSNLLQTNGYWSASSYSPLDLRKPHSRLQRLLRTREKQ